MTSLSDLELALDYKFQDAELLLTAITHRSYLNEHKSASEHNERLEFLGDAVLELIVTDYLYRKYPASPEGELTAWRSALVKGEHLAEIANELQLGSYLRLSRGEAKSGGREKAYLLANALESIIGAVYLDGGIKPATNLIEQLILPRLTAIIATGSHIDAKSRLQELAQDRRNATPEYKVIQEAGPDHAKEFTVSALVNGESIGTGKGPNKQAAEQAAAKDALGKLKWS
jgi:ribonuclease-3